jgi:adenine-specific DNA-methyltransferase
MTTDPGDLVLDPTCGSGTAAYVAEEWGRRWITIDTSRVALTSARARLMGAKYDYYLLKDSETGAQKEGEITGKSQISGPFTRNLRHGFVYERVPHVTLKSIANKCRDRRDLGALAENTRAAARAVEQGAGPALGGMGGPARGVDAVAGRRNADLLRYPQGTARKA